jgi:hypothetical protein
MLGLNVLLELVDIAVAVRANKTSKYFFNLGNLFDWLHFGFMGSCLYLWLTIYSTTEQFVMKVDDYPVLHDAYAGAKHFAVDPINEEAYLQFVDNITEIAEYLRTYNALAGGLFVHYA